MIQVMARTPKGIMAVSIASMLIAISTSMTFSVSPFYMTAVLGLSMFSMGMLEGISEGISQLGKLASGISGDVSQKKKPTLLFGFILAAASKPVFIFAGGAEGVAASKLMERASNGIMATPRDAYIADEAPPARKGECFGIMMTLKTFGCVIGSFLIGGMMFFSDNYTLMLWAGFIPCMLAIFMVTYYVKENTAKTDARGALLDQNKFVLKDVLQLPHHYWSFVLVAGLYMLARFSDGFLMLRLQEMGAPLWLCGGAIGVFNLVSALCCYPLGKMSDSRDRCSVLYFSVVALILANVCMVLGTNLWWGIVGIVFWGAQRGTSQLLFSAVISDVAPKHILGTALGIFYLLIGLMAVGAGILAGWLAAKEGLVNAFVFGAVVSGVALLALMIRNKLYESNPMPSCSKA